MTSIVSWCEYLQVLIEGECDDTLERKFMVSTGKRGNERQKIKPYMKLFYFGMEISALWINPKKEEARLGRLEPVCQWSWATTCPDPKTHY